MKDRIQTAIAAGNENVARQLLQHANDKYYGDGSSPLTDADFDQLQALYTAKFGLPLHTAPSLRRTDRQAIVPHDWPFLSNWLSKVTTSAELEEFLFNHQESGIIGPYVLSPKYDGMSVVITYDQTGNVLRALTRGDEGLGVDVTRLFKGECHFRDYDFGVPRFGIKYEVVLSWGALEQLNVELGLEMKNPRNTVAGIVSSDDPASRRPYLTLVPLDIEWDGCEDTRMERLEFLQALMCGYQSDEDLNIWESSLFTGNDNRETPFLWYIASDIAECLSAYEEIHTLRSSPDYGYMLDGVICEYTSDEAIALLGGRAADCPKYIVATKFPSMIGHTVVLGMDYDIGNSGRVTPVVNYQPLNLDGRTFSRSSISNMVRFDALKLCVGTPLLVEIRGDVNNALR